MQFKRKIRIQAEYGPARRAQMIKTSLTPGEPVKRMSPSQRELELEILPTFYRKSKLETLLTKEVEDFRE